MAEEFQMEFLAMPEEERMNVLRKILPGVCRNRAGDPRKARELYFLLTEECGSPMANMIPKLGMTGRKGESCCG